jgi:ubiquinone/menaquinone biosynthesis C-methylase UbiE
MHKDAVACFDRWAEDYDRAFLSRHIRRIQKQVVHLMSPAQDASVLDVGCGTGEGIRYLRRFVKGGFLAGLDISPQMIEVARAKFSDQPPQPVIELKVGDAEQLPWPGSFFDQAMSTFTLHHFPHPNRALTEIARVLKPGGRLFLVDLIFPGPFRRLLNWILRLFEGAQIEVQTLDSMREIFLQTPLRPDSPYRLAPLVFLFVGEKGAPAAKEKGTGIA